MEEIKPSDDVSEIKSSSGAIEGATRLDHVVEAPAWYELEHQVKVQFVLECAHDTVDPRTPGQFRQARPLGVGICVMFLAGQD
jgi:hypothetical protein